MVALLMGTAGSGKTTVGTLLARQMGWKFADGDDFHPPENIRKISQGIPLTDADRRPWLAAIRDAMNQWASTGENVVVACSALKQEYRDVLQSVPGVKLVFLKGSYALLLGRLHARKGHFAGEQILKSQFTDLEEPTDAIVVNVAQTPEAIVAELRQTIGLT